MRYFVKVSNGIKNVEFGSFASRSAARTYAASKKDAGYSAKITDRQA